GLVRWNHPRYGAIPPSEFIPLAEQSGLITPIGDWVLEEACRNCVAWLRNGHRCGVSINVSAVQFERERFPSDVIAVLRDAGMDPSLLTLEITETVLIRDIDKTRQQLAALRRHGIRIAIDDFGTGYSSLNYITSLPADIVKLDRSFVHCSRHDKPDVVELIVDLAHRLGLKVVAEGVETESQRNRVRGMNCDTLQGYFFGSPLSAGEVPEFLRTYEPCGFHAA
ncbi:MAG: EAL domain-containing protein, partial [Acidobacteriota bacterium]|nr:EAL domain-containing protein [Acidobacteriota bacterium]